MQLWKWIVQLEKITLYRVQLQTNRPVERSIEEVTLQRVQLQRNHHVESSATKKPSCREFSYKQISLQRDLFVACREIS